MSDGGKGSNPRPFSVDQQTYASNWEAIFGKKTPKEIDDAKAEDEAFAQLQKQKLGPDEYDGPNRNTSNF